MAGHQVAPTDKPRRAQLAGDSDRTSPRLAFEESFSKEAAVGMSGVGFPVLISSIEVMHKGGSLHVYAYASCMCFVSFVSSFVGPAIVCLLA